MELAVDTNGKHCSRCKKFKSADQFYKQGDRLESLCKQCKLESRHNRNAPKQEPATDQPSSSGDTEQRDPQSYEDLGFTKEEFLEIADFFQELLRMKGRSKWVN